jgi:cation diffusion facilitator family transporter
MTRLKGKKVRDARDDKRHAALTSVLAALGLVGFKLVVGVWTNSLGILSEAAHSGLDLVAALVTYLAVRVSDKPADEDHHYGHGKVENLSALFETILLLGTCVWIIHEATRRLFVKPVEVDASIWAFLVMSISIVVDISRSRMLYRAARTHNSQALEADALHFRTDIWSSSVVILGLAGVLIGNTFPSLKFMEKADAIAALGVAFIVVWVSFMLGKRTLQGLLDAAPAGLNKTIVKYVEDLPGVTDCHQVRIRISGPCYFVDVHVSLDGNQTLNEAHRLTETIESTIRDLVPRADVTVHPEPAETA